MQYSDLIVDQHLPDISYLTAKQPEIIHPRVTFKGDVPYVYCQKKSVTLETFLRRFASGEEGLWLAGYRASNGRQSTITFSETHRLTLGRKFLRTVESLRTGSKNADSKASTGDDFTNKTLESTLRLPDAASNKEFLTPIQVDLEQVSNLVADEYANKPGEDVDAIVKRRIGQGPFRALLQKSYGTSCWLSGLADSRLLIASHIVPWSLSDPNQKTDPENGLLLSVSWDALFDKGYVSFDDDGHLLCSDLLSEDTIKCLGISRQSTLSGNYMTVTRKRNLAWHRKQHGFNV